MLSQCMPIGFVPYRYCVPIGIVITIRIDVKLPKARNVFIKPKFDRIVVGAAHLPFVQKTFFSRLRKEWEKERKKEIG